MKYTFSRKQLSIPYAIFMLLFVVFPLLVVIYYACTDGSGQPSAVHFLQFFRDSKQLGTLVYSFMIAIITTIVSLLIAYPVALILAKGKFRKSSVLLLVFVMPMWINFTLRITALKEILTLLEGNLAYHPFFNTVLCMVYDFLPFMILPLYNALSKLDDSLIEASQDLGATRQQMFLKVVLPLSMPGIMSGVTMVFLPAMTNYVVLDMVYNSTYIMGSLIGSYFSAYDWHNGSMISIVLLALILAGTLLTNRVTGDAVEERTGGRL